MTSQEEETFETEDVLDDDSEVKIEASDDVNEEKTSADTASDADGSAELIEENIAPTAAFQRFAGRIFDPSSMTSVTKDWKAEVFESSTKNEAKFESPLQKYQRLQREIGSFEKELSKIQSQMKADSTDPTKDITHELNQQLSQMWGNVEEFKSHPQLASLFAEANQSVLETVDSGHLFKRLQQFQASKNESESEAQKTESQSNRAVFTLYSDGSINHKSYRMAEIDERLKALENIVGTTPENPSVGDMVRSVEFLSKRMDLLSDDMRMDGLVRRAKTLKQALSDNKFDSATTMEDQITKAKERKIATMFEMMERWDQSAQALPSVVTRLKGLNSLHQESADMVQKVQNLGAQQKLIKQTLDEHSATLKAVNQSLADNAKTMSANVQSIEQRIVQLQERMKKMGF